MEKRYLLTDHLGSIDTVLDNSGGVIARTAIAATAGGLAAELTGGKFANGTKGGWYRL